MSTRRFFSDWKKVKMGKGVFGLIGNHFIAVVNMKGAEYENVPFLCCYFSLLAGQPFLSHFKHLFC